MGPCNSFPRWVLWEIVYQHRSYSLFCFCN